MTAVVAIKPDSARHRQQLRVSALSCSLSMLVAVPCAAQSLRVDYELGASYLHSDNINLSETAPDSDAVLAPELRFDATQAGSRVQLEASGVLQYLFYRDDTYDDEFAGEFTGRLNWTLLPERINFVVEDYLARQTINVAGGATPGNQEQVNVFIAGPSLFARFSDAMRGQLDLRYSDTYAEENEQFNGNRYSAAGRLFRELGALDWLSLNAETSDVNFDLAPASTDYRRYDAYLAYRRELALFKLDAAVGYSRLDLEGDPGRVSSPLARASLDWNAAPRSTINAAASYSFGDTASDLVTLGSGSELPIGNDDGTNNVAAGAEVFHHRRLELGYRYAGERLGFELRPYYERIDYVRELSQDLEARGVTIGVDYRLQPLLMLSFSATRQSRELFDGSQEDEDSILRVALSREFNRHWSGMVGVQRRERDSSIVGFSYDENLAMLGVTWRR